MKASRCWCWRDQAKWNACILGQTALLSLQTQCTTSQPLQPSYVETMDLIAKSHSLIAKKPEGKISSVAKCGHARKPKQTKVTTWDESHDTAGRAKGKKRERKWKRARCGDSDIVSIYDIKESYLLLCCWHWEILIIPVLFSVGGFWSLLKGFYSLN